MRGITLLLLLAIACNRGGEARQRELMQKAEQQQQEYVRETSRPVPSASSALAACTAVEFKRTEAAGMTWVVMVYNHCGQALRRIEGQVSVIRRSGQVSQMAFDIPIRLTAHTSREHRMEINPRWDVSDEVTLANFSVTGVEPADGMP